MTKPLSLKKVLAALLTMAARQNSFVQLRKKFALLLLMLATGLVAHAMNQDGIIIQGWTQNNYYSFVIQSFGQTNQLVNQTGTSHTFNNTHAIHGTQSTPDVTLNGTLNFQQGSTMTDVITSGGTFTVTIGSSSLWFYGATVQTKSGANVSGCTTTVSSDNHTLTVSIPSGRTFSSITVDYVANEPFNSTNTTISGIEATYIYQGSAVTPVPTVTYKGTVLTAGTDYTVSYANNNGAGTATLTVTGTGEYAGTVTRTYTIRNIDLNDFNSLGNNTYEIANKDDLDHLALLVDYAANTCQGLTFKQTADIAYTYTTAWNSSTGGETNFTAIGGWGRPFKGTFDGQNHSISGIRISKNGQTDSAKCQGLFGFVYTSGTVRNVILADTRIRGYTGTGGIVGVNSGTIEDCRVQGNVLVKSSGAGSNNISSDDGSDFGGIAGNNNGGTVTRCTSSVTIDGFISIYNMTNNYSNRLGGIVGNNSGTVSNCLALNAVVTGDKYAAAIVGNNGGTLTANHYRGCTVTNDNHSNGSSIGVGVGTNYGSEDQDGARSVHTLTLGTDITATGESVVIDGTTYYASNTTITLGYSGTVPAGQMPVYSVGGTAIEGNTFTMPAANRTVSVTFAAAWSGSGTSGSPYVITTTAQLDALASAVKGGTTYSGTYFVLGNDIAYSTVGIGDTDENFTTIGGYFDGSDKNFSGTFNGQNHTISGIRLYKNGTAAPSMNQGLFGRIDGATIENVILADARITGYRYVGGLVGNKVSGTVQNCLVLESTITCANTYVGALFGKNNGTITSNYYHNCTVNGATTNIGTNGGDVIEDDGAVQVFSLTLGEGITATPAPAVTCDGINYYTTGTEITLNANAGYAITSATLTYGGNDYPIVGNSFEMPAQDVAVTAVLQVRYTFDSTTGALALLFGEFNKDNKWGNDVDPSAVTSVTATDEVSFTGDCSELFSNFTNCTSMDLGNVNTDALNNTFRMFDKCLSLLSLEGISDWDVSNVTNMIAMFRNCSSLSSLDLSDWNTANVTNMSSMFAGSGSLTTIYVGTGWNTESVTSTSYMFDDCSSLTTIDLSNWNTGNVTDMNSMFNYCSALQSLNISSWNTANVTIMKKMFYGCSNLQSLDLSGWNTANVTDISQMFDLCSSLQSLDLSDWNTSNVENMDQMFDGCSSLETLDLSGWNTANVTDMYQMFRGCSSLQSLDLTGWSTSNVEYMSGMFYGCSGLQSLDLTGWNTSNVWEMGAMFYGCSSLTTIYAGEGWNTYNVWDMSDMFEDCTSLVGGMGTTYDAYHTDAEYARIDRGPNSDQPGYFTGRFNKKIAGNQWYFFASPVGTAPVNMDTLTDLYFYDEQNHYWRNRQVTANAAGFDFAIGKGYLGANAVVDGPAPDTITLAFVGTPTVTDETYNVPVSYHATTSANATNPLAGWNLVGNPFACEAYLAQSYYVAPATGGANVIARTGPIACCEGVMVQAAENQTHITFSKTAPSSSMGGVELTLSQNVINRDGVSTGSTSLLDNAIVSFNEGSALEKFVFNVDNAKLYIPQDGKDYAIVSVGRDVARYVSTEMPVNFKAMEDGTYTITVNTEGVEMRYLHLIDNMTGADVDLLATPTYTFTAKTTDYESRFKLVFSSNGASTGSATEKNFAYYNGSVWYIDNEGRATLQVVDMLGRIISSETINGSTTLSTNSLAPGVYIMRLVSNENLKTQKVVVK